MKPEREDDRRDDCPSDHDDATDSDARFSDEQEDPKQHGIVDGGENEVDEIRGDQADIVEADIVDAEILGEPSSDSDAIDADVMVDEVIELGDEHLVSTTIPMAITQGARFDNAQQDTKEVSIELDERQREFFQLLRNSFSKLVAATFSSVAIAIVVMPWLALVASILGYGVMRLVALAINPLAEMIGNSIYFGFVLVPIVCIVVAWKVRGRLAAQPIRLSRSSDHFILGQLSNLFRPEPYVILMTILAFVFGIQIALIQAAPGNLGLAIDGRLGECIALSLDNIFFGMLLDFLELYGLSFSQIEEHTVLSATVFFAFRICFELLLALQLFYLVQAYRMRVVLLRHGLRSNQPNVFVGALESIIAAREYRSRRFFDETMFLSAAAFYLKGNEAAVIQLGRSLPKLRVALDARKTFVGVNQESLLDG